MAMPRTLAEKGYRAPNKKTGTIFQWANGEELWTWMGSHPDRALNMVAGVTTHNSLNAYPWSIELASLDLKDEDVAIVDVGGGRGHIGKETLIIFINMRFSDTLLSRQVRNLSLWNPMR